MTREEIIRMAREAGGVFIDPPCGDCYTFDIDDGTLERFAALVAAAERDKWMERTAILIRGEREACAKTKAEKPRKLKAVGLGSLLDEQQFCFDKGWREGASSVRAAIRARGETK